jgi:hypothetical protein
MAAVSAAAATLGEELVMRRNEVGHSSAEIRFGHYAPHNLRLPAKAIDNRKVWSPFAGHKPWSKAQSLLIIVGAGTLGEHRPAFLGSGAVAGGRRRAETKAVRRVATQREKGP